jgi:hypothetical protein
MALPPLELFSQREKAALLPGGLFVATASAVQRNRPTGRREGFAIKTEIPPIAPEQTAALVNCFE